ncbi:hypothetical protein SDJN03_04022, partial [Cucurbita argyrosperma subsp. sororia]
MYSVGPRATGSGPRRLGLLGRLGRGYDFCRRVAFTECGSSGSWAMSWGLGWLSIEELGCWILGCRWVPDPDSDLMDLVFLTNPTTFSSF